MAISTHITDSLNIDRSRLATLLLTVKKLAGLQFYSVDEIENISGKSANICKVRNSRKTFPALSVANYKILTRII